MPAWPTTSDSSPCPALPQLSDAEAATSAAVAAQQAAVAAQQRVLEQPLDGAAQPARLAVEQRLEEQRRRAAQQMVFAHGEERENAVKPVQAASSVGRNDPCPCGSGKKYKKCHGKMA